MIRFLFFFLGIFMHCDTRSQDKALVHFCLDFKQLLVNIREEKLSPQDSRVEFKRILNGIGFYYPTPSFDSASFNIMFPMQGLNYTRCGGRAGEGYRARHFDLFDNKKTGSHPAQDIFVRDATGDEIDDRLHKKIELIAVANAIVLAVEHNWQPGQPYRGGNYIWLYDLENGGLWYYAHASVVDVDMGDFVRRGEKIGMAGRTGLNAYKKTSETHLHLMYLSLDADKNPRPVNTYQWLKNAQTAYNAAERTMHYERPFLGELKPLKFRSGASLSSWQTSARPFPSKYEQIKRQ